MHGHRIDGAPDNHTVATHGYGQRIPGRWIRLWTAVVDVSNHTVRLRALETCDARCGAGQPLRLRRSISAYGSGKMRHVVVACAYRFPSTSVMMASAMPTRLPT